MYFCIFRSNKYVFIKEAALAGAFSFLPKVFCKNFFQRWKPQSRRSLRGARPGGADSGSGAFPGTALLKSREMQDIMRL